MRARSVLLVTCLPALLAAQGCCTTSQATPARPPSTCSKTASPQELDLKLEALRKMMMDCIGRQARRGHVGTTHQCYRGLRLVESARWWIKTLVMPGNRLPVYQPTEVQRRRFLCAIERLAAARTPKQVELRYLEMIRYYP